MFGPKHYEAREGVQNVEVVKSKSQNLKVLLSIYHYIIYNTQRGF